MSSLNKVTLIGNLGKDPEVIVTASGAKKAKFPLATSTSWTDDAGNKAEKTEWHNIVDWKNLADVAEKFLKKGNQVCIEGSIQTRSWDDTEGQKKYITEINGSQIVLLGFASEKKEPATEA